MKKLSFANQKGGMAKSTCSFSAGFYSSLVLKKTTLLVDLDPQSNLTKTALLYRAKKLGQSEEEIDDLVKQLKLDNFPSGWNCRASSLFEGAGSGVQPLDCGDGIYLIASDKMQMLDVPTMGLDVIHNPRLALDELAADFDVCIIDTPPTLGVPLYAALVASDYVVCPCKMDQYAIDGLGELFDDMMRVINSGWNQDLKVLGLLATLVNPRRAFHTNALEGLREAYGEHMFNSVLYDRAATEYAKDRPVWLLPNGGASSNLAGQEMKAACKEIFEKAGITGSEA